MVGVPGKSKGCNTCRKRKISCDGDRPSCARCTKSNRICGGYQRERHFKNLSALDRDTLLTRTQPLASLTDLLAINTGSDYSLTTCSTSEEDGTPNSNRQMLPSIRPPRPPDSFVSFINNYIPREEGNLHIEHRSQVSWLQAIDPSQEYGASLDLAISALSLVSLGRKHGDVELRREGRASYGRALRQLQDILSQNRLLFEEQTLASCMALYTFELLEVSGEDTTGWVSHAEGIARLIQLRGPESHVVGLSHRLFLGFRSTGITHALATRKSTYLAHQDWLTVPWKMQPKSDFDKLLDIMAQIAILIEKARGLKMTLASEIPHVESMALVQQGWDFYSQLDEWYQGIIQKHNEPLYYEQPGSTQFVSAAGCVFPTSLHFANFEIARLHVSYWSILLFLFDRVLTIPVSSLSNFDESFNFVTSVVNIFTHRQALELARLIARSMDYLLSEDKHILGPQKVFFPLRTAMHVFASTDKDQELAWCQNIFEELDRRGYPFGKILARCEWDDIPALLSGN
ncbi:hypothetical protein PV10_00419 [Exophiala mesophila]|uniref:Zn(2)-C6 fungal-type domain-containing protein n=1 Tax=Exophiala mesophila TaxID=212818 RepID=A0A0D1Y7A7_EXOME|nr:uncharacterized protein PV10_00419 [Exophiala mesophila]KIV96571.1 hypothetical protein PV10_00419 [Exophiala mesophila]